MAWYRNLPPESTSGVDAKGVKGVYCDNGSKPEIGKGIGGPQMAPNRTRATRLKWKAQYAKNKLARAALNAEFRGDNRRVAEFHMKIVALSTGCA